MGQEAKMALANLVYEKKAEQRRAKVAATAASKLSENQDPDRTSTPSKESTAPSAQKKLAKVMLFL